MLLYVRSSVAFTLKDLTYHAWREQAKLSCSNLTKYIEQTFDQCLTDVVSHLKEYVKPSPTEAVTNHEPGISSRVSGSFDAIFWPKLPAVSEPLNPPVPDPDALDTFQRAFSLLLLIQLSYDLTEHVPFLTPKIDT